MRIKSVAFSSLGPFAFPSTIELDKDLTVLTGANDSGKSRILRGLELLLTKNQVIAEDINEEKMHELKDGWKEAKPLRADIEIVKTENSEKASFIAGGKVDDIINYQYNLHDAQKNFNKNMVKRINEDGISEDLKARVEVKKLPLYFSINPSETIRREIPFDEPNQTERKILNLAFGEKFTLKTYRNLDSEPRRKVALNKASMKLTEAFNKYLPNQLNFTLHIIEVSSNSLSISVSDAQYCHVESHFRGSGFQRMLSIFAQLVHAHSTGAAENSRVITIDEPELHLHSDAQRRLRKVIEEAAKKDNVQIIYSTHSPCFINTANPPSVRLVKRTVKSNQATSIVENVTDLPSTRLELGVAISESLAIGAVTVVVEGETEYRSLLRLLLLLSYIGNVPYDEMSTMLGQTTFVDGHGNNLPNYLRIIEKFGAKPVVLLDGDVPDIAESLRREHPLAILGVLGDGKEYEDIIPFSLYLLHSITLSNPMDPDGERPNEADYEPWIASNERAAEKPTSKRVETFLYAHRCKPAPKQNVFTASIESLESDKQKAKSADIPTIMQIYMIIKNAIEEQI